MKSTVVQKGRLTTLKELNINLLQHSQIQLFQSCWTIFKRSRFIYGYSYLIPSGLGNLLIMIYTLSTILYQL